MKKKEATEMLRAEQLSGCITALITPFNPDGSLDLKGLETNLNFQMLSKVSGVVPVGTTGESPTLTESEHCVMIVRTAGHLYCRNHEAFCLAGCGSNSTAKALYFADIAVKAGCSGGLFVDPFYNGPSSFEIRDYYYDLIAREFPSLGIVPYVVPGRTGCAILPQDLAILVARRPNVLAVKEASGDLQRMRQTRDLLPEPFQILSGDDDKTFSMIIDQAIRASGVISVISNIAPLAISRLCRLAREGSLREARILWGALDPLFKVVTVSTRRTARGAEVIDKFRNPLPVKTMMQGLGMPSGPCRPPLGKMSREGVEIVRQALCDCWVRDTWILRQIEDFYGIDIVARLSDDKIWQALAS